MSWVGKNSIESRAAASGATLQARGLFEPEGGIDAAQRRSAGPSMQAADGPESSRLHRPPVGSEQSEKSNVRKVLGSTGPAVSHSNISAASRISASPSTSTRREPACCVPTEGEWDGSLSVFKQHYAPHFLLGVDRSQGRVRIAQLVQVGTIGAALVTHNWLAIVQVEMIGYSKETLWRPDDETAEAIAALMAVCKSEYGIPLAHPWPDGDFGRAGMQPTPERREVWRRSRLVRAWAIRSSPDTHWDPGRARVRGHLFALASTMPEANASPTLPPPAPPRPGCDLDLSTTAGLQMALKSLGYRVTVDGVRRAGERRGRSRLSRRTTAPSTSIWRRRRTLYQGRDPQGAVEGI